MNVDINHGATALNVLVNGLANMVEPHLYESIPYCFIVLDLFVFGIHCSLGFKTQGCQFVAVVMKEVEE